MNIATFFLCAFSPAAAFGEVIRFTDGGGKTCYVDSIEKIPEEFRSSAQTSKGRLSKLPSRKYEEPTRTAPAVSHRPASSSEVEVYLTEWCPFCKKAEAYLKANHIRYRRFDIEHDPAAKQRFQELGGSGFPLIRVGSHVINGFDEKELAAAFSGR